MTVSQLKKILETIPDSHEVRYEYDGPESRAEVQAHDVVIYSDRIILVEWVVGSR